MLGSNDRCEDLVWGFGLGSEGIEGGSIGPTAGRDNT